MQAINIIAHPQDAAQLEAIKAVLKALKVNFEIAKEDKKIILTKEQQQILDSQVNADKSLYLDAEQVYNDLKNKYDL